MQLPGKENKTKPIPPIPHTLRPPTPKLKKKKKKGQNQKSLVSSAFFLLEFGVH